MIPTIPQHGPAHHTAHRRGANRPEMPAATESTPVAGKASAPGQAAKAMIAEAIAGGAGLPANIQGKAASAIARGVNMETFFASFMPAVEPPAGEGTAEGEVAGEVANDLANDLAGAGGGAPPDDAGEDAIAEPGAEIAEPESGASSHDIAATLPEPLVEPESGEGV